MTREATWLQTFSGKQFIPLAPTPEMICIEDIAHGLAQLCRFSGQTPEFYSVADHSLFASAVIMTLSGFDEMSRDERRAICMAALFHDASESYIVDIPSPIKKHLQGYKEIEDAVMQAIATKFGLDMALFSHPLVKEVDMVMLATEKRDLMGPEPAPWLELPKPWAGTVTGSLPKQAEAAFLARFEQLGGRA